MSLKPLRSAALPLCLLGVVALGSPTVASADPCASSTPNTVSYSDSAVDAGLLAPEITGGTVSLDSSCSLALSYSIPDQSFGMLPSDFMGWFIDTDGNAATGSQSGFTGADYAIGRTDTGAALTKYNPASGKWEAVKAVGTVGDFGAQASLNDLATTSGATMKVAGAGSWTSSSTGNEYMDFVPDVGQAAVPFTPVFAAAVAAPAPVVRPATTVTSAASSTPAPKAGEQTSCTVPLLKGLSLGRAKIAILDGNCSVGRVRYSTSAKYRGRVIKSALRAGTKLASAAPVDITVGKKPRRKKAKKHSARRRAHKASVATQQSIAARINALAG